MIQTKDGQKIGLGLAGESAPERTHSVDVNGTEITWTGPFKLFHSEKHKTAGNK